MILVKKYGNRRLYDTSDSRYITLEELAEKIRAGAEARIVDAKTGEDLTQATLTQIIMESRRAARLLPVPFLTQLIRMREDALAEFLGRYLSWALAVYQQVRQGARTIAPYNPFAMAPFAATNALARLLTGGADWSEPPPPPPASSAPAPAGGAPDDVAELRRELEELKKSLRSRKRRG
jgi:polyhydroxyalkanoate synthesis repressor PhaR